MMQKKSLKLLLVSMQYNYGKKDKGLSYDWNHFYGSLQQVFNQVDFFDYMEEYNSQGKKKMQEVLLSKVKRSNYDVIIFILYTDQFDCEFVNSIRQYAKTMSFFHDDNWRQSFVKQWAPNFDFFTTTDPNGVAKYLQLGLKNAIFLPFGVNEFLFYKNDQLPKDLDITFIGAWHPYRAWLLKRIKKAGFKVHAYGCGWGNGVLDDKEMVNIFQRSKISLNLSNSISYDMRYVFHSPYAIVDLIKSRKNHEQLKGRHFEIPACGAMQLSFYVDGLESVFQIGKEIAVYISPDDLLEKIGFYMQQHTLREQIANSGYLRVMHDHTYAKRFIKLFSDLGFLK